MADFEKLLMPAEVVQLVAERRVTLSTVVGEEGLAARADEALAAYRTAFSGFTAEERGILDGVDWEPISP